MGQTVLAHGPIRANIVDGIADPLGISGNAPVDP